MDNDPDQGNADDPLPALPTVNFHFWAPCNMRCGFCFAPFNDLRTTLPKGHLPRQDAIRLVEQLAAYGFQKITFVGGEPTLAPWLPDLLATAKRTGMVSSLVTNGTKITTEWLEQHGYLIDWIALSIDSLDSENNTQSGRAVNGQPFSIKEYSDLCHLIKSKGIRLRINTVVHALNWQEQMGWFIEEVMPFRWKIMQVLPVTGENDSEIGQFEITSEQFQSFLVKNQLTNRDTETVPESNDLMRGSYVMVNPAGCFFDNSEGGYTVSDPILKVGVANAINQVTVDAGRFFQRGGLYDFLPVLKT